MVKPHVWCLNPISFWVVFDTHLCWWNLHESPFLMGRPEECPLVILKYPLSVDGCEILHQLIGGLSGLSSFIGFQPSHYICGLSSFIPNFSTYHSHYIIVVYCGLSYPSFQHIHHPIICTSNRPAAGFSRRRSSWPFRCLRPSPSRPSRSRLSPHSETWCSRGS